MKIFTILISLFVPICVTYTFTLLNNVKEGSVKYSKDNFTVYLPKIVLLIGIIYVVAMLLIVIGFTVFSDPLPHLICYILLGGMISIGIYLILKALKFKIIVKGDMITACFIIKRPCRFKFSDIVSAQNQRKKNNAERIVIKLNSGKKIIVENIAIHYEQFKDLIKTKVDKEKLVGF